jgi:hypothetical protein
MSFQLSFPSNSMELPQKFSLRVNKNKIAILKNAYVHDILFWINFKNKSIILYLSTNFLK